MMPTQGWVTQTGLGHVTNPLHQPETHSGGIQHVDSMTVHINSGDGVHVASPVDPWAH